MLVKNTITKLKQTFCR